MPADVLSLNRRQFLSLSSAGLYLAAASPSQALPRASGRRVVRVLLHYRTDPDRIARMLPPPLKPADKAEVWVEYALAEPGQGSDSNGDSSKLGPFPASYGWSGIYVAARHEDLLGWLPVGLWTSHEWGRIDAREASGLGCKAGVVELQRDGASLRASLRRDNTPLHRLQTELNGDPAPEALFPGCASEPIFAYRYGLDPDWTQRLVDGRGVELWKLETPRADDSGKGANGSGDGPQESVNPLAGDLSRTTFDWATASSLDPAIEFPVQELLAVQVDESDLLHAISLEGPSATRNSALLRKVAGEDFQPWALLNYDRPTKEERPWSPPGWRGENTAYKLTPEELTAYQSRPEIRLNSVDLVDMQLVTEREIHSEVLPPQFTPGLRLRLLALRVEAGDLSPQPFQEVWLFAYGLLEKERVWYALSHIVTPGGDVVFGRETFGYPSKLGEVDIVATPTNFSVLGRRHGRDFLYTEGWLRGFSTGTSLLQMRVAGLRAGPFGSSRPARGELIVQPWHFQGQLSQVMPESVAFEFPEPRSRDAVTDPWFEFNPVRVAAVSVMHYGAMQREPGQVVAQWDDFHPFYRERCDGILPGESALATIQTPTFRAKPAAQLQSGLLQNRRSS